MSSYFHAFGMFTNLNYSSSIIYNSKCFGVLYLLVEGIKLDMGSYFFTSESVTEGHPDKLCDQISDAILDKVLEKDPNAHVACEVTATAGFIHVMGEISTNCYVDIDKEARNVITDIGYNDPSAGFDGKTCGILTSIHSQSPDIALGVNEALESKLDTDISKTQIGAGDQGMVFGFACDETPELMPLPISLAHKLSKRLTYVRKKNILNYLQPDGKTQVTIQYENGQAKRIDTIVVSSQHSDCIGLDTIRNDLINNVIFPVIPKDMIDKDTKIFINPTGRFVVGGPVADSGLTGRKIIVDTYGGYSRHGGGAFSGKDPTKVDRSAAYAARYVAKNIVAAKIAKRCEVQIAYAIGVANPVSVLVETFGTSKYSRETIQKAVNKVFDLRPKAIIEHLDLRKPIYRKLATYGHMGREDLNVLWEKTDKANDLLETINKLT